MKIRTILQTSLMIGAVAGGSLALGVAAPASAHTPAVTATCDTLSVALASYDSVAGDLTPNTITVTIDGAQVDQKAFGGSFTADYALDKTTGHAYAVIIDALGTAYDTTETGSTTACPAAPVVPTPPAPVVSATSADATDCTTKKVTTITTTTTTGWVLRPGTTDWVADTPVVTTASTTTDASAQACPIVAAPTATPPAATPPVATPPAELASTGVAAGWLLPLAALMLGAGALVQVVRRLRLR
jgi:hypothetical protein